MYSSLKTCHVDIGLAIFTNIFLVNIDFGSSLWLSSMVDGQHIKRTVDGNIFTITSSGNVVYINGFPVTADQWNQALSGKEVILSFQGTEAILNAIGSNVMFNGKSLTTGSSISTQVSYGKSASSSSNFVKAGNSLKTYIN